MLSYRIHNNKDNVLIQISVDINTILHYRIYFYIEEGENGFLLPIIVGVISLLAGGLLSYGA